MNEYKIIDSRRNENGTITHIVDTGGAHPDEMHYVTVRGGLSWPNQGAPAYYILFGQIHGGVTRFQGSENSKKLRYFREFESRDLSTFFKHLCEDAALLRCESFYVEKTDASRAYEESLAAYRKAKQIEVQPYLEEASYIDNFEHGAHVIREWLTSGSLTLPEGSIIHRQIFSEGIDDSDFASDVAVRFYAVNALRHVINAFNFQDFRPHKPMRSRRRDGMVI
jgi:hypothetical protein